MHSSDTIWYKWTKGIAYEVAFWNNVCRWAHTFEGTMNWSGYGNTIQLEHFDVNDFLCQTDSPKVLDVGCGMSYATGNYLTKNGQQYPLDIHYVDPLAHYFNQILRRHHRELPDIDFGMMESLHDYYPEHDVALVIIQNALDHSAYPLRGIIASIETLQKGGILYLNHHPNEAETEHYKGFHQYNIIEEEGHLIIWNKDSRWDVNKAVSGFADVEVCVHDNGHVIAIIRKNRDVPAEALADKLRNKTNTTLTANGINYVNRWDALKYKLNYWKYNTIQFFVQALPWHVKMKLKRLIGQA